MPPATHIRYVAEPKHVREVALTGTTDLAFSTGDHFAIAPSAGGGALGPLAEAGFRPKEWVVRADGTHGKSKTYRRTEVFADEQVT